MKKLMNSFGLTGSALMLVGSMFKIFHWPSANIQIGLGTLLIALVYLPMFYSIKSNNAKSKLGKSFYFVCLLIGILILITVYFKLMHWPGANILKHASLLVLVFLFLPALYVYKKSELGNVDDTMQFILPVVVCVSVFVMINLIGNSRKFNEKIDFLEKYYQTHSVKAEVNMLKK